MSKELLKKIKMYRTSILKGTFPDNLRPSLPLLYNIYDPLKLKVIEKNTTGVFGKTKISLDENEAIVFCLVKNGEEWLKDFIKHYMKKGFKHIIFLDTGSKDNTISIAKKYSNITILTTKVPFKHNNILLRRYLVEQFGKNTWCLTVDIDELWDYPYSDKISLATFLKYQRTHKYNAVVGQMLDMFTINKPNSKKSLNQYNRYSLQNITKRPFLSVQGFSKNEISNKNIKILFGGIRKTLFNSKSLCLTKVPLIFYDDSIKPLQHQHYSINAHISDISTVLYHYKLTKEFEKKVINSIHKNSYANESEEYLDYKKYLDTYGEVNTKNIASKKLKSTTQLITDEFMVVSKKYETVVRNKE